MTSAIRPQMGPQTDFAACSADLAIFASMPGSGKSYALCLELARWHHLPKYTGMGFRAEAKQLVGGATSLFGTMKDLATRIGGTAKLSPTPRFDWSGGATVLLNHANTPKKTYDGTEVALSCWDELDHFELDLFRYITESRARTTCGLVPYARASVMPSPGTWVHELAKPWLTPEGYQKYEESGRVRHFFWDDRNLPQFFDSREEALEASSAIDPDLTPTSLAFIFAKTTDNVALMKANPEYLSKLAKLDKVERLRLKDACWEAYPESVGLFDRRWFRVLDQLDPAQIVYSVRGWDRAAKMPSIENPDPDWSVGARLDWLRDGSICISDVVRRRARPGEIRELICATAKLDGPHVMQRFNRDPGSAGLDEEESLRAALARTVGCGPVKVEQRTGTSVIKGKDVHARPWSAFADPATKTAGMSVVRAAWNGPFLSELEGFPSANKSAHDDQVDAVSDAWTELAPRVQRRGASAYAGLTRF